MDAKERARLRALRETIPAGDVAPCCERAGQDGHHSSWALGATPHGAAIRAWVAGPLDLLALARTALPALLDDSERLDAATRERDEARAMLRNLLARVHRDGGQHSDAVGLAQATEEADEIIARDFAELARLRAPRPSAIVLRPVDPMTARGLLCACDEWGSGHLDGCPSGDESTDGRDA